MALAKVDSTFNQSFEREVALERIDPQGLELKEKVVHISRVAKVVKGGRRFSFSALVVTGDSHSVGWLWNGQGERSSGSDPQEAWSRRKKNLIRVPIMDGTIPSK
jgi:small subunit ribosomal protein S5